jgi:hypothetical protein
MFTCLICGYDLVVEEEDDNTNDEFFDEHHPIHKFRDNLEDKTATNDLSVILKHDLLKCRSCDMYYEKNILKEMIWNI